MATSRDPSDNGHIREHLRYGAQLVEDHLVDTYDTWYGVGQRLQLDVISGDDTGFAFDCRQLEETCHDGLLTPLLEEQRHLSDALGEFGTVMRAVKPNLVERQIGLTGPLAGMHAAARRVYELNDEEQSTVLALLQRLEEAPSRLDVRRSRLIANMGPVVLRGLKASQHKVRLGAEVLAKATEAEAVFPVD